MKNRIGLEKIINLITIITIILTVFLPTVSYLKLINIFYIMTNFFLIIIYLYSKKVRTSHFFIYCLVILFSLTSFFGDKFNNFITFFTYLIIIYTEFCVINIKESKNTDLFNKIIYYFGILIFAYLIYYNLFKLDPTQNFYFISTTDKNFSSVYIFLFTCFCLKIRKKLGVFLSLILSTFFFSRLFSLAIIILVIFFFLKKKSKLLKKIESFDHRKIFITIIFITFLVIGLSYYMSYYIPISSITRYRESFNDNSNARRVRANVYAVNELISDWKLVFIGYDSEITEKINQDYFIYLGFPIIQPHNFLLNLLLRFGLIMTLLYLYILCKILQKFWRKGNNIVYIFTYLFMNMFMHSLLTTIYLLFFVYILNINDSKAGVENVH